MTAVSSPLEVYTRRVSFNNLDTDDGADPNAPFGMYPYSNSSDGPYQPQKDLDVSKFFGNYSMSGAAGGGSGGVPTLSTMGSFRKRIRLPEPPSKLILKNRLTPAQLQCNIANAAMSGLDLSGLGPNFEQDHPENDNDTSDDSLSSDLEDEIPAPTTRRKLFTQMTDEELMALDPQFSKPKTSNLERFKFDLVTTYYLPARRGSTVSALAVQAAAKLVSYPSLNENNYKSISLTLKHQDYDHEDNENRTLLTVISGRKHTWNSLDWLLLTAQDARKSAGFLQDGDYLVVAALVPFKYLEAETKNHSKRKTAEENLYKKCDLILRYILDNLPDSLIKLRITVELVMDVPPYNPNGSTSKISSKFGTKMMISHLFKQYNPSLVILGNRLTNLNFKYPLRIRSSVSSASGNKSSGSGLKCDREASDFLIKLSSYMVKYSTVPVILVGNSTVFHHKIERKPSQSVKFFGSPQPARSILDIPPVNYRKNSAVSDNSIELFTGGGASPNEQRSIISGTDLKAEIEDLTENSQDENRFAAMMLAISLSSLADSQLYLSVINDTSVDRLSREITASRVHQAYISGPQGKSGSLLLKTSLGTSTGAYRVKSLILYSEEDEKKNEKLVTEKKLRKSISRSSVSSSPAKSEVKKEKEKKEKRSFLLRIGLKKS